jgi:hypothetical protein
MKLARIAIAMVLAGLATFAAAAAANADPPGMTYDSPAPGMTYDRDMTYD